MVSQSEHIDTPPWLETQCIGGHFALDFVNTVSHRLQQTGTIDRFNSIEKICSWLDFQSLLRANKSEILYEQLKNKQDETQFIASILALRNHAGRLFDAIADNQQIPADTMARVLSISSHPGVQLINVAKQADQASVFSISQVNAKSICALFGLVIVDGIFRLPTNRIHACPRCGWLFYDRSKGGRRKWCDMKACGNREKVAKHYLKNRQ